MYDVVTEWGKEGGKEVFKLEVDGEKHIISKR